MSDTIQYIISKTLNALQQRCPGSIVCASAFTLPAVANSDEVLDPTPVS